MTELQKLFIPLFAFSIQTIMAAQNISFTAFRGTKDGVIATKSHFDKLEDDQALVKVTHSGLCFSDFHMKTANIVLGHEGVGIVEDLGSKISYLKKYVGENVIAFRPPSPPLTPSISLCHKFECTLIICPNHSLQR